MVNSATEISSKISLGWNIRNTLEASGVKTAWNNPKVSTELIDFVKQSGFNPIQIPRSWDQYLANNKTEETNVEWLNRVEEVIQYCINNDMYVVINIHWDGGWLENNINNDVKEVAFFKQFL